MPITIKPGDFKPTDTFGIYRDKGNPFSSPASARFDTPEVEQRQAPLGSNAGVVDQNAAPAPVARQAPQQQQSAPISAPPPAQREFAPSNFGRLPSTQTRQEQQQPLDTRRPSTQFIENEQARVAPVNQQVEQYFNMLDTREPGRYRMIDKNAYDAWKKDWDNEQPWFVEDAVRLVTGGTMKGTGTAAYGLGEVVRALGDVTTTPIINSLFGTNYKTQNLFQTTRDVTELYGNQMQSGLSEATKEAMRDSTPDGSLLEPDTWTLGNAPSLRGYTALALDVFGQMAPIIAAGIATGGTGAALTGGAQGGGSAAHEAEALIDRMAQKPGVLEKESAYYRELIDRGLSHADALERTKAAARQTAFALTAPISAAGGYATQRLMSPATKVLNGRNWAAQIAGRAALSGAEEGVQEAAESAATRTGVNVGAGTNLNITDGTFADFVLGALAGGPSGAGGGVASVIKERGMSDIPQDAPTGPLTAAIQEGKRQAPDAPLAAQERDITRAKLPTQQEIDQEQAKAQEGISTVQNARPELAEGTPVQINHPDLGQFVGQIDSLEENGAVVYDTNGEILFVEYETIFPIQEQAAQPEAAAEPVVQPVQEQAVPIADDVLPEREDALGDVLDATQEQVALDQAPIAEQAALDLDQLPEDVLPEREETIDEVFDRVEQPKPAPEPAPEPVQAETGVGAAVRAKQQAEADVEAETVSDTVRSIQGKEITFEKPEHAKLYDLGEKIRIGRVSSLSPARAQEAMKGDVKALADELEISESDVREIADDFRYRTNRNVKDGFGKPVRFNDKRLADMQRAAQSIAEPEQVEMAKPATDVDAAAQEAATSPLTPDLEPTQEQKEAGNYKLGHVRLAGRDISIENPAGSKRRGTDEGGQKWSVTMKSHYGYFKNTEGSDKDHIDTFIKPGTETVEDASPVFVVDQVNEDGSFDEHKVMVGYKTLAQARKAYMANYSKGWAGLGDISKTDMGSLKKWFDEGNTKKPFKQTTAQVGNDFDQNGDLTEEKPASKVDPATKKKPASWVITNKKTGEVVMETFDEKKVEALNTDKFEAKPIGEHLASLNEKPETTEPEKVKTEAKDEAGTYKAPEADKPLAQVRGKGPKRGEQQLYVTHNISADGVRWAEQLGGLPAPSLAIAGADTGFDNFGEISLIWAPEMAAPDKSTRVFNADVYSPRQPRAEFDIKRPAFNRMMDKLDGAAAALGVSIQGSIYPEKVSREGLDAVAREDVTRMAYLMEQGKAPKVKYKKKAPVPAELKRFVKTNNFNAYYEDADFNEAALKYVKGQIEEIRSDFAKERAQGRWIVDQDGKEMVSYSKIDELLNIMRESQRPPQVDGYETGKILRKRTQNAKGVNTPEYTNWIEDNFGEVLGAQFFTDENRRRKPYELNALVRDMTRTIRDGEGFNYGIGSIRSTVAKPFKSLEQIKGDRGQVVDEKTMEAMKEEVNKEFSDLADEFAPIHSSGKDFGWHDIFSEFLKDLGNGNLREWQTSIFKEPASSELVAKARTFLDKLTDMPTEYFEIKMQRAVDLSEFHTALVDSKTPKDVVDTLRGKGLKIVRYTRDNEGKGRQEALDKVSSDVFFRTGTGTEPTNQNMVDMLKIVQEVGGLKEPEILDTILIDEAPGWNMEGPAQAAGLYYPIKDVIVLAADIADNRTAYHESFHRLQNLYLTDEEKQALKADAPRLKRIVRSDPDLAPLVKGMSQNELEAEAFAIYAEGNSPVKPYKSIRAAWDAIADVIDKIKAYVRGENINATSDLFEAAKRGEVAKRTQRAPSLNGVGVAPKVESEAFKKWFGDSKVVDADGKPLVMYHGTPDASFTDFKADQFFTSDKNYAKKFLTSASASSSFYGVTDTNPSIFEVYLKSENPFDTRKPAHLKILKEKFAGVFGEGTITDQGLPDWVEAREIAEFLREELADMGFDAVLVDEGRDDSGQRPPAWVIFNPTQIKSVSNRGTFDPKDPNVLARPKTNQLTKNATADNIIQETIAQLKGAWTDLSPNILQLIPLNYFEELAQESMKGSVKQYMRHKMAMDTFRGDMHAKADNIAQEWLKATTSAGGYLKRGVDKTRAAALSDLMHQSTLAGVDPSSEAKVHTEAPQYEKLRAQYDALPPSMRNLYKKVRDAYKDQSKLMDQIILDNIKKTQEIAQRRAISDFEKGKARLEKRLEVATRKGDKPRIDELKKELSGLTDEFKMEYARAKSGGAARMIKMRKMFEKTKASEPYFPLARVGDYFVSVRDEEGDIISFSRREKAVDRDKLAAQMRKEYPGADVEVGVLAGGSADAKEAMDPRVLGDIQKILGEAGVDEAVMDQVWQRYLESMPDLSARKRFIHRKGTAGFDQDALKAFSKHMFHSSHQMARLKYGLELQETVNQISDEGKEAPDPTKGTRLANQFKKNHEWVMNPTGSAFAQKMNSTAFVWFLAATPAAALVNLSQTPMMGLPIIGAHFGFDKAAKAMYKSSADSVAGRGSVAESPHLTPIERKAMKAFEESGLIDKTQAHDLAGVGDTGVNYSPLAAKTMGIIGFMFHRAEVWNREVTALTAYRAAVDAGQSYQEAIETAHDLTWKSHFDYSNSSRPSILQNDFAKVALVFRSHSINMLYRVFRDIHQSVKGETPEARRIARRQLIGVMAMFQLFAGTTGMFGFNTIMGLLSMVFSDDDDPLDFTTQVKKDVIDLLGPQIGGVVLDGVPGSLTGVDLSSRIGFADLWFRSPSRDLEGQKEFEYYAMSSLGAGVSMVGNWVKGANYIRKGQWADGIEVAGPKSVRDTMRAYRRISDGIVSKGSGNMIVSPDQIGIHETVSQLMGFTPASVSAVWDRNNALNRAETKVMRTRSQLMNRYAMAYSMRDDEALKGVIEDMKEFNRKPYARGLQITGATIKRSLKARMRAASKRQDGVIIENKVLDRYLRGRLPGQ